MAEAYSYAAMIYRYRGDNAKAEALIKQAKQYEQKYRNRMKKNKY
ncbi:MAG: hypothetical protein ACK574_03015 [Bacteroidota bacterium]